MPSLEILAQVEAFSNRIQREIYKGMVTSVLMDPNYKFTTEYATLKVPYYIARKGLANYSKEKGWTGAGGGGTFGYQNFTCDNDRTAQFKADVLDSMSALVNGTPLPVFIAAEQFYNQVVSEEIDTVAFTRIYDGATTLGNKVLETSTFKTGAINMIVDIDAKLRAEGVYQDVFVFLNTKAYACLQKEIINNPGFASQLIKGHLVSDYPAIKNGGEPIEIGVACDTFNNLRIIVAPDNRMATEITFLDGETEGQEDGGFTIGETLMSCAVVPKGCTFSGSRHSVAQLLLPTSIFNENDVLALQEAIKEYTNNIVIEYAGLNQKANGYELNMRLVYDTKVFKTNAKYISVYTEDFSDEVTE